MYSEVIDCERGYNLNIGTFYIKWQMMRAIVSAIMENTKEYRTKDGKRIVYFVPEEPTCCQIHTHIQGATAEQLIAARDTVEKKKRINVFRGTPQPWRNFDEMDTDWTLINRMPQEEKSVEGQENNHHFIEWMIGEENSKLGIDQFVLGWKALCKQIVARQ